MAALLEIDSTLTDRYQTTVPETVRRALNLRKRDKLHYLILPDGVVMLTRADHTDNVDPVLGKFLNFLERDISTHPEQMLAIDSDLVNHIHSLVGDLKVDINTQLSAEDE